MLGGLSRRIRKRVHSKLCRNRRMAQQRIRCRNRKRVHCKSDVRGEQHDGIAYGREGCSCGCECDRRGLGHIDAIHSNRCRIHRMARKHIRCRNRSSVRNHCRNRSWAHSWCRNRSWAHNNHGHQGDQTD